METDMLLYLATLHAMGADREVPKPHTLTPSWPLAQELYLADLRGDNLADSGHVAE